MTTSTGLGALAEYIVSLPFNYNLRQITSSLASVSLVVKQGL